MSSVELEITLLYSFWVLINYCSVWRCKFNSQLYEVATMVNQIAFSQSLTTIIIVAQQLHYVYIQTINP